MVLSQPNISLSVTSILVKFTFQYGSISTWSEYIIVPLLLNLHSSMVLSQLPSHKECRRIGMDLHSSMVLSQLIFPIVYRSATLIYIPVWFYLN